MLRDAVEKALWAAQAENLTTAAGRDAVTAEVLDRLALNMFGAGAVVQEGHDSDTTAAKEADELIAACKEWTGQENPSVHPMAISGPAVELGDASYLAMETGDDERARIVLGYDLPESGRVYWHRFAEGARVFVMNDALVIRHPAQTLTPGGLHEPPPEGVPDEDEESEEPEDIEETEAEGTIEVTDLEGLDAPGSEDLQMPAAAGEVVEAARKVAEEVLAEEAEAGMDASVGHVYQGESGDVLVEVVMDGGLYYLPVAAPLALFVNEAAVEGFDVPKDALVVDSSMLADASPAGIRDLFDAALENADAAWEVERVRRLHTGAYRVSFAPLEEWTDVSAAVSRDLLLRAE